MRELVLSSSFKRAFKRLIRRTPALEDRLKECLQQLSENPFHPSLKTHKLKGKLAGVWACSLAYDCRIVFDFQANADTGAEEILLIDVGSHDEVY